MKIKIILLLLFCIIGGGCISSKNNTNKSSNSGSFYNPAILTPTNLVQHMYMWKYESVRNTGISLFKLKINASVEDFRPHIAKFLGLPESATFLEILAHPKVKAILTEERRRKIIETFHLSPETDWIKIQTLAENTRLFRSVSNK